MLLLLTTVPLRWALMGGEGSLEDTDCAVDNGPELGVELFLAG